MEWYYILGAISYGIFILQFLISLFGPTDTDLDVDFDGNSDFDLGDLVSFKGLIHFTMGFSGWLMIIGRVTVITVIIAIIIGIVFTFILYCIYKLCMRLNSEPTIKSKSALIGEVVIAYIPLSNGSWICKVNTPTYTEITCVPDTEVKVGDILIIKSYENGIYYVSK